jgi:WD40 repeat protein
MGFGENLSLYSGAVSPSGRQAAAAFAYGEGEKALRVWDLESGEVKRFDLPSDGAVVDGVDPTRVTGSEGAILSLWFADETTLYSAGDGGVRRWDLTSGTQELVAAAPPGYNAQAEFSADGRVLIEAGISLETNAKQRCGVREGGRADAPLPSAGGATGGRPAIGTAPLRPLPLFGGCETWERWTVDPSGRVAAVAANDGTIRVGRLDGGEPHLLVGHKGTAVGVAISPDLRWVATVGDDTTLRLWPMPDLSKPSLHTLPHDQLLAALHSLTNLRAVRDPSSSTCWTIEVGPFPGWKHVPTW